MFIIEYLGAGGVITRPLDCLRFKRPCPGDAVLFPDKTYGMVDGDVRRSCCGQIHVCRNPAGAFWALGQTQDRVQWPKGEPYVSISGGPFEHVKPARLKPTYTLHTQVLWNWGDHHAGAHQGVEYLVPRPVFELIP